MRIVRCSGRLGGDPEADTPPNPEVSTPPGQNSWHLWKHYLSATSVADGNNDVNTRTIAIPQYFALTFLWLIRYNFFLSFTMHTSCKFPDTINKFELVWGWISLGLYLHGLGNHNKKAKGFSAKLAFCLSFNFLAPSQVLCDFLVSYWLFCKIDSFNIYSHFLHYFGGTLMELMQFANLVPILPDNIHYGNFSILIFQGSMRSLYHRHSCFKVDIPEWKITEGCSYYVSFRWCHPLSFQSFIIHFLAATCIRHFLLQMYVIPCSTIKLS